MDVFKAERKKKESRTLLPRTAFMLLVNALYPWFLLVSSLRQVHDLRWQFSQYHGKVEFGNFLEVQAPASSQVWKGNGRYEGPSRDLTQATFPESCYSATRLCIFKLHASPRVCLFL